MNYKIEEINLFLYELQELSKEVIDERQVYLQLITYHLPNKDKLKDLTDCLIPIIKKYEKKFKISNLKRFYILENKKNTKNNFSIKIHVPLSEKTLSKDLGKIIDYLSKSKIDFTCKISVVYRVDTVIIDVYNEKDTIKIIQFLNKTIKEDVYILPFYTINDKIYLTLGSMLSYNEILSKYLYNYILQCSSTQMQANFEDFMMYIYKNLIEFNIKEDLSNQLNMLEGKVPTNYYLKLLEEITSQIYANLQAIKINFDNKSYVFDELNKMQNANYENLLKEDYKDFTKESFETDEKILEELINVMTSKYGFENAKKSIIKYQKSIKESEKDQGKKIEYITRENNIREKIIKSKSFTTYMSSFKEEDLKKIIDSLKPKLNEKSKEKIKTKKEMILEEVCRETYLAFQNENRNFSGKLQVARALIRMENGDYSPITRRNNARLIAEENIKMDEVLDIIKKTLERKGYIIENHQDLYELYAMHIEYLCQK